eukprot:2256847-Pleurochrysis_carterae.AAC.1
MGQEQRKWRLVLWKVPAAGQLRWKWRPLLRSRDAGAWKDNCVPTERGGCARSRASSCRLLWVVVQP